MGRAFGVEGRRSINKESTDSETVRLKMMSERQEKDAKWRKKAADSGE